MALSSPFLAPSNNAPNARVVGMPQSSHSQRKCTCNISKYCINSAKELDKYQFEISLVVDKEIAMSSACDVEISSPKMRCTAELDGESGEYLSDLSTGAIYYALDTPLSSDRDPSTPENIKWVKVESDLAVPQFSSPVASNPLAILDSIEELNPTEVSDLSRNGETYKGFKVNIPKDKTPQNSPSLIKNPPTLACI